MRLLWVCFAFAIGCDESDGPSVVGDAAIDTSTNDAPAYQCAPPFVAEPPGPPACLDLDLVSLEGTSPLGIHHEMYLQYVGAGDCITLSQATLTFVGACTETMTVQFSYPVTAGANNKRYVPPGGFDRMARVRFTAPDVPGAETTASVHVDVVQWQEGDGVHDIDISLSFTEPGWSIAPIRAKGSFCEWPYQLC